MADEAKIAYFSMEIAVESAMPTYSGGLGVLAGDTIRSAADVRLPIVAVSLVHRKGYFRQRINGGWQIEEPVQWKLENYLSELPQRADVEIDGRTVHLRAWKYEVAGISDFKVPIYFLDADLQENSPRDRTITDVLYGGDEYYRLCQEVVLGIGGVRMLRSLGYQNIDRFHMNEGHASLLTLELLDEETKKNGRSSINYDDVETIRRRCVFTTHTPVAAGNDQFSSELASQILGRREISKMKDVFCYEGRLNMTYLGLNLSHYVNGVAKKHGEISSLMFAGYKIDAITNGVHAGTWTSASFQELYDKHIQGWRQDNFSLRYALSIPREEVWSAHVKAKQSLMQFVNRQTNVGLDVDTLTIGFARRATAYKRASLLFQNVERLKAIASKTGGLQVIYSGKAHPRDQEGKQIIKEIFDVMEAIKQHVKIVYLENYDIDLAKMITAGVDVWLNTPQPPLEASGTSGMKAALNGVPSLSILDGWWIEGCIEGITGWSIGEVGREIREANTRPKDAESLYEKLEQIVLPIFYTDRNHFVDLMRHAIAMNGSFFNTQRMLQQYVLKAYFE
jgi:glycogen phosphorylase